MNIISNEYLLIGGSVGILLVLFSEFLKKKRTVNLKESSTITINPKYLTVGAIYFFAHDNDLSILKSNLDKHTIKRMLKRDWDVSDHEDATQIIELGISGNIHANNYNTYLNEYQQSQEKQYKKRRRLAKTDYQKFFLDKVLCCKTTLAWDLERAAQVTRYACTLGYLTEEEAYAYLKDIYTKASDEFSDWYEYSASFLLGRNMWRGESLAADSVEIAVEKLLKNSATIWNKYQLNGLKSSVRAD